jgi:hypothetical protein
MRRFRMLGLCLVAVFAVAAVAATSALAGPEWGKCVAQANHEGRYTDSNCTKKAKRVNQKFTGEFEWRKGRELPNEQFTSVGGPMTMTAEYTVEGETIPITIECATERDHGEIVKGKKLITFVEFFECRALGAVPCHSAKAEREGEVRWNTLTGTLGYINKASREVGLLLRPAHGRVAVVLICEKLVTVVVGRATLEEGCAYPSSKKCGGAGFISAITPVNQMTTVFTRVSTFNEAHENLPSKFEGKPLEELESYIYSPENPKERSNWAKLGMALTTTFMMPEARELKA